MADDITIGIKTTADTSGVEAATTGFAGQTAALDRMKAAADAAAEKIRNLDSSNAVLAPGLQDVAEKADAFENAVNDARDQTDESAASNENLAGKMQLLAQTATGLGVGLSALSDVARNNGHEELANDLSAVAGAMTLVTSLAAGGLQLQAVIASLGGLQAAIITLRATAVASLAAMGPYFAAIAAGAAAYYAAKQAADFFMGTVEEMDAKLERASVSIGGVTLSLAEEKEARDKAKESIDGYRDALTGANDELERNIELAGNQEQVEKARINADIRKRQAEIDAQSAAFTRTGGREGLSPEQAIVESQRLEEEKIKRINQAEEQQRRAEEQALQKAADNRRKDLQEMQGDNAENNAEIDGATGRYSLSKADRQALLEKGRAVETARQKYGADSAEVEAAMQEYTAAAVAMNEEEKADLLRRLTLREALSKNIEAAAADLDALEQKIDKTLRDNQKEREITEIETDASSLRTPLQLM